MPIYEYHCNNCHRDTEILQDIDAAPITTCPHCQSSQIQKKISVSSFRLTGTGWYETDFKNSGSCKAASGGSCDGCKS